jgi:hypothetical protein
VVEVKRPREQTRAAEICPMSEMERQEWEQTRTQSRARFILREGVLRSGLCEALIIVLVLIIRQRLRHHAMPSRGDLWDLSAGAGVVRLGAGWIHGAALWEKREKQYLVPSE